MVRGEREGGERETVREREQVEGERQMHGRWDEKTFGSRQRER